MLGVNPYMLENERFRYFACNAFKYYNLEMTVFTSNCSFLVFAFVFKYDLYFFLLSKSNHQIYYVQK